MSEHERKNKGRKAIETSFNLIFILQFIQTFSTDCYLISKTCTYKILYTNLKFIGGNYETNIICNIKLILNSASIRTKYIFDIYISSLYLEKSQIEQFNSFFVSVKKGDVINLNFIPTTGTEVIINDKSAGLVEDDIFFTALLKIWLGDEPADSNLKKAMLDSE